MSNLAEDSTEEHSKVLFCVDESFGSREALDDFLSPNRPYERPHVHIASFLNIHDWKENYLCDELSDRAKADRRTYITKLLTRYVYECAVRGYQCTGSILEEKNIDKTSSLLKKADEIKADYIVDARYDPSHIRITGGTKTFSR